MSNHSHHWRGLRALLGVSAVLVFAWPLEGANLDGCPARASCSQRGRRLELDAGADKRACQCDQRCAHYDDCCADATWATPQADRVRLGAREIQRRRRQWHCHRVNPIFGDVLLKASCAPDWLEGLTGEQLVAKQLVQRRCEYVKDRGKRPANRADVAEQLADPLGTMMPITDLTNAVTYANSYCLRCNKQAGTNTSRLIYWPPLLECNYNREQDDRNTLIDLISARKGRVLQFSVQQAKWLIQADPGVSAKPNSTHKTPERQCTITPTIPDSVEHMIRYCRSSTIDTCAPDRQTNSSASLLDSEQLQRECLFGHQSLAYSSTSDQVYFNPSCARCNGEQQPLCEPKKRKSFVSQPSKMVVHGKQENASRVLFAPTSTDELEDTTATSALDADAARSGNIGGSHIQGAQISGSFTVLLDLYGSSQDDEQVGAVHQCPDAQAQVFDPFFLTCRDVVCGLNHQFVDGRCVPVGHPEAQPSNLDLLGGLDSLNGPVRGQMGQLESPQTQQMQRDEFARLEGSDSPLATSTAVASSPTSAQTLAKQTGTSSSGLASSIEVGAVVSSTTTTTPSSSTGRTLPDLTSPADAQSSSNKQVRVSAQLEVEQLAGSQSERPISARLEAAQVAQTGANQLLQREKEDEGGKRAIADEQFELEQQFQSAIVNLNANDLPQPTSQSRLQFVECGKILVDPNQYRLFSVLERAANGSERAEESEKLLSIQLLAERASQLHHQRKQHQQQHQTQANERQSSGKLYAFVSPYNLTLASSQFELVRHRKTSGELSGPDEHFSLLICSPFRTDLVDKFKPAMATLTSVCLLVSITSLLLYLFLYCLSMFDLRHLQLEMSNWQLLRQRESGTMENLKRASRDSNETGSLNLSSSCTRSQSLSSRGVACLASSLLFAYLLFILGHQQSPNDHPEEPPEGARVAPTCLALAVATYYCFLFAFSWMLLLAYDIWRTLRLATCQLRAPANHAQSRRFLSYMLLALTWPALIVATSLLFDLLPLACDQPTSVQPFEDTTNRIPGLAGANCSQLTSTTERFVRLYRPKFGHQPTSCWFSNRRSLALFFGLPVALIMVLNLLFFLHSSFMVIRTSSRSSRKFATSSANSAKSARAAREASDSARRNSASHSAQTDFSQLNSLTASSILSIQSRTSCSSASSSSGDDSPPLQKPPQPQAQPNPLQPAGATSRPKRPLESSISSHSIGSANSIMSSTVTGLKCESSQVKALSCVLSTVARDYRLYCRLSTIMGLTWLTGLMASLVDASSALWYLFVLLNTLQGLFIFIAFGCKRSKLSNLYILLAYLRYRSTRLLAVRESGPDQTR